MSLHACITRIRHEATDNRIDITIRGALLKALQRFAVSGLKRMVVCGQVLRE